MLDNERRALEALMQENPSLEKLAEAGKKPRPAQKPTELVIHQAIETHPAPPPAKKLEFYSAATLYGANIERPPIIIDNLIPAGLTVLAGAPKRGKSWMALKMALCIASGEAFFGMPSKKGAVLYLDLESKSYRVQDRLSKLMVGPAPQNLYFAHRSERLDGGLLEQLKSWIACVDNPSMIIIDTLGRVKGGTRKGENAYESDTRIFGELQTFALESKIAVVCVHHLKKDNGNNDDYFERISGSMGITGACDAVMVLAGKRGEENSVLRTSSRDFEAQDFVVKFNGGAWSLVSCDSQSYQEEQAYVVYALQGNGSVYPLTNCEMYTFDFTATDDAVNDFIVTKMLNTYLGLDAEAADELTGGYLYPVISGPFQEYNINSTNCFTATATWCKWLGYNTLYSIASAADSYTDYIAWRMYDRYGSAWTYIGQF